MPASQVKSLFAAPAVSEPPPLPQDSPSTPANAFGFEPHADPGTALAKRMTRPMRARLSKPILAAIIGGALLVIVIVIYGSPRLLGT